MKKATIKPFPLCNKIFDPDECVLHAQEQGYTIKHKDVEIINEILLLTIKHFDIPCELLMNKKRTRAHVMARHAFRSIITTKVRLVQVMIGAFSGGVDHTTIIHSINTHNNILSIRNINDDCATYAMRCDNINIELDKKMFSHHLLALKNDSFGNEISIQEKDISYQKELLKEFSNFFGYKHTNEELDQFLSYYLQINTNLVKAV